VQDFVFEVRGQGAVDSLLFHAHQLKHFDADLFDLKLIQELLQIVEERVVAGQRLAQMRLK